MLRSTTAFPRPAHARPRAPAEVDLCRSSKSRRARCDPRALFAARFLPPVGRLFAPLPISESSLCRASDSTDVAIAIARREIHVAVNVRRLAAQRLLDQTERLHELLPVDRAQETQAGDAVADRNLIGRLALAFLVDELLDREPLLERALFEPAAREVQHRI